MSTFVSRRKAGIGSWLVVAVCIAAGVLLFARLNVVCILAALALFAACWWQAEQLIHTVYTLTLLSDEGSEEPRALLTIRRGRFLKLRNIDTADLADIFYERRLGGLWSYLLLTEHGGRLTPLQPENPKMWLEALRPFVRHPYSFTEEIRKHLASMPDDKAEERSRRGTGVLLLLLFLLSGATMTAQTETDATASALSAQQTDTIAVPADSIIADAPLPLSCLPWPEGMQQTIDSLLLAPMFETSQVALLVYDLTADSTVYSRNPRLRLRPASTMKLLTAVTALERLGESSVIRTELFADSSTIDSLRTLHSHLYLRGGFDPCINTADLRALADAVSALGCDTLRGNIYADLSMTDGKRWGEGWCWDDDNPTLTPLLLNGKPGLPEQLARLLRERGIVIAGSVGNERTVPPVAELLTTRYHTIGDLLPRTLKNSDNLYAEALFYQIAASTERKRGATAADAARAERELLQRLGLSAAHCRIADGSGLSLYNHLTAELEVALLRYAYRQPQIYAPLYRALPIAGVDGTLNSRMRGTPAAGNVRAKTGSLETVSTLAGYCQAANGHRLAFAILNNGLQRKTDGRHFQDKVCNALCRKYAEN